MRLRFLRDDHYDIIVNLADAVAGLTVEMGDKDRRIAKLEAWVRLNYERGNLARLEPFDRRKHDRSGGVIG